jgi:glycosyltransferase involved in cell wall biosynthesis
MANKKILFISDFNLDHSPGGAQRSNDLIINKGRELGHSIFEANYNFNFKVCDFNEYDIIISSNLEGIYRLNPEVIEKISQHKFHVRLEHDLNRYLSQEDREKLFKSCKKTIFLTDFHYKLFIDNYGDIFNNVEIITDPIDTDIFYNKQQEREDKILYVGFMHELKGTLSFFEYVLANPNAKFVIAGWGKPIFEFLAQNLKNIEYLGPLLYEKMPEIYNKYDTLFYSPILPEPFCRSVAEATLCGVKLMSFNPNIIGCVKDIDEFGMSKFKENCKNASNLFWEKILE